MTPFRVLHVCTGNLCRSPMAELLMRAGLQERGAGGVEVTSAGTWARTGSPMDPGALRALRALGVDGRGFVARELAAGHVAAADLVLTATREHRAAAVVLEPAAAARTFTLKEFARLAAAVAPGDLTGDPGERGHGLVAAVAALRGRLRPDRPGDDDLADPYRGPQRGFDACARLVADSLRTPVDLLAGVPAAWSAPAWTGPL